MYIIYFLSTVAYVYSFKELLHNKFAVLTALYDLDLLQMLG
jgi:hypothetical protein